MRDSSLLIEFRERLGLAENAPGYERAADPVAV
jgi:hypothetical protein